MEKDLKKWQEQWQLNYKGDSPESRELQDFMKSNYKDHKYIPWATMVRLMYAQDPNSSIDVVETDGDIVNSKVSHISTIISGEETVATVMSHNIKLEATFLGKTMREVYPVQDNSYGAPKVIDSNMVNKAIQRAKARLISTITGLAFTLYENGDLQFEEDSAPVKSKEEKVTVTKNPVKKTPVKKEAPKKEAVEKELETKELPEAHAELYKYIKETPKIEVALQVLNTAFINKFGFAILPDDSDEDLANKILKMQKPETSLRAMKKIMADKVGE